jgi:tetratricopeptide (TPR) repeat protein
MVPPQLMLTNKNSGAAFWRLVWALVSMAALTSCGPPGPRALLKGEQLIHEGKYAQAIPKLEQATQQLPKNAQAWNHLGLAYHGNNQPLLAIRAYRQALVLDNKLAAARYNLGCLYLDQNELPNAIEQLTSYTYVQPNTPDGWVKLGTAQLRSSRLDLAERHFRTALDLQANNLEALNGLGLLQYQKRRYLESFRTFQSALAVNPKYPAALLNAAIAAQAIPANRPLALQFYHQYLALKPPPEDFDKIAPIAAQLDAELNPPKPAPVVVANPVKTNTVAVAQTNTTTRPVVVATSQTNALTARTNQVALAPRNPTNTVVVVPSSSNTVTVAHVPTNPAPIEVSRVDEGLVIKPAQELSAGPEPETKVSPPPSQPATMRVVPAPAVQDLSTNSSVALEQTPKPQKKGFFSRIFSGKAKTPSIPASPTVTPVPSSPEVYAANGNTPAPVPVVPPTPLVTRRYTYLSPSRPAAGNRAAAERFFADGARAQSAGILSQAIANYKRAVATDPAYFDAYFNLSLAAYEAGNWNDALSASENALAINPESQPARYSLALALRQAKYPQDAAEQLELILQRKSDDTRAHLTLANLYADQLHQPQLAREHYQKVLQLEPSHPKAASIRSWLASNPPG